MTSRTILSTVARLRSAWVVISPATTARSVVTRVSQATRLAGSISRQWSRTASLIWSATLSGWPIDTDSLVNRYRSVVTKSLLAGGRVWSAVSEPGAADYMSRRLHETSTTGGTISYIVVRVPPPCRLIRG